MVGVQGRLPWIQLGWCAVATPEDPSWMMALVFLGGDGNRRRHNIPMVFRDRMNPLDVMNDHEIIKKYRLDRDAILEICAQTQQHLVRPTSRSQSLPVCLQVLVALRYYATGSFQSVLADGHGISIRSVSRSIHAVSKALTRQVPRQIKFPTTRAELKRTKQLFHDISGFPNVIGAVDGTKGFHAINGQGICSADNLFINIVVRWPESTHDSFIWNSCECVRMMCTKNWIYRMHGFWAIVRTC
ncbi:HARB1-like protein [Mya arenaria]|uniref:HARB1-like protein n=1 Tax=Mya arenaria TaxID=6604 RepID=A0ABY7E4M0_MYAAR|nr:HARB1-like protein [Mya arenaria]